VLNYDYYLIDACGLGPLEFSRIDNLLVPIGDHHSDLPVDQQIRLWQRSPLLRPVVAIAWGDRQLYAIKRQLRLDPLIPPLFIVKLCRTAWRVDENPNFYKSFKTIDWSKSAEAVESELTNNLTPESNVLLNLSYPFKAGPPISLLFSEGVVLPD